MFFVIPERKTVEFQRRHSAFALQAPGPSLPPLPAPQFLSFKQSRNWEASTQTLPSFSVHARACPVGPAVHAVLAQGTVSGIWRVLLVLVHNVPTLFSGTCADE